MSEPYRISLSHRFDGMDIAEMDWAGQRLRAESRHGASMALARTAVAAGAPDGPWEAVQPPSATIALYGPSLHALARLTVRDNDSGGVKIVRYQPYPGKEA